MVKRSSGVNDHNMARPDNTVQPGSGTLFLILIQVASRALTFIGNQFLLRFLSPTLLGISVQLELVSVTSLYFARDSLRVALQRQTPTSRSTLSSSTLRENNDEGKPGTQGLDKSNQRPVRSEASLQSQMVVNLSYLSVMIGFFISVVFGYSYVTSAPTEALSSPYFTLSFQIYAFATLTELLAEPCFLLIQQKALYKERARAETTAAMARCLTACVVAVLGRYRRWEPSILPFAMGQAAYSTILLALYFHPALKASRREDFSLVPTRLGTLSSTSTSAAASVPPTSTRSRNSNYLDLFPRSHLVLAGTMYMQSIFKLLLTQGDALILSFLSSLADQGAFALASNYGGLLARLVFQPVEESSRNTFGRLVSSASEDGTKADVNGKGKGKNPSNSERNQQLPHPALTYLANILHFYLIFSLPLITLAPYILPLVVRHVLSASWYTPSTALLLSTYCYYIPFMAVNGILDAFVTSVATPAQLRTQSLWMVACTAVYGGAAWVLLTKSSLGASGLIWANMLNMALRVAWSMWFVAGWVGDGEKGLKGGSGQCKRMLAEAVPSTASIVTAGAIMLGLRISGTNTENLTRETIGILAAGTVLLGSTM